MSGARNPQPTPDDGAAPSRRIVMKAGLMGAAAAALGIGGVNAAQASVRTAPDGTLRLTPTCTDGHDTPSNIEGPFFKRNSPLRTDLVTPDGQTGVFLSLKGSVFDERCKPVAGALIEFWQCDRKGVYDNKTYRLRGHQFTAATGAYTLETVVPKDYDQRCPHIHVKVQAPKAKVLTTQLFFPDDTKAYGMDVARLNRQDDFIDRDCTIVLGALAGNRYAGSFDFVVPTKA
jgi:protocatechuate 3,4-dioxygenase beta subunit